MWNTQKGKWPLGLWQNILSRVWWKHICQKGVPECVPRGELVGKSLGHKESAQLSSKLGKCLSNFSLKMADMALLGVLNLGSTNFLKTHFNECILIQLVSFVILHPLIFSLKNIILRRGPWIAPACKRGSWHTKIKNSYFWLNVLTCL